MHKSIYMCYAFLIIFIFLISVAQTFALTAKDLADLLNEQLSTGKVLLVMKWNPEKQTMIQFNPLTENASSPNNFEVQPGENYFILTNITGIEYVELPFQISKPQLTDGWNLAKLDQVDINKYDVKVISCFDPESKRYIAYVPKFNTPEELFSTQSFCWIFIGEADVATNVLPHIIYGTTTLNDKPVSAKVTIHNLDTFKTSIVEAKDGKFTFDLLNIGYFGGNQIMITASYGKATGKAIFEVDLAKPVQRVDILLEKPSIKVPFPVIIAVGIVIIFVIFIILKVKKKR